MSDCSGLLTPEKEPVSLKSIDVQLEVRDHVATVVSTLSYQNKEDKPLEAVFVSPLPGDAAVCHFSAEIGQTHIVAEVKEKQQAREEYDDALSSGQQAFLLEQSVQSPDIFSLSVGSLPPGESASIRLEYVTELAVQADDGLRFCLPAVLNPRYQPQGSEGTSVQVTSVPASPVPYSLSFSVQVSSPRPVSKVESSCSLEPLQYLNTDQTQASVKLAAGHKFDRDIELLIYYKDAHQPTAVVEAGQASAKTGTLMGDPVVMLSLYPEFSNPVTSSLGSHGEFVFLLDRSGSMDFPLYCESHQSRIASARDTLLLLLKSLPMGCYFNIYSFGHTYEHIFPKSVKYSRKTLKQAVKKVEVMDANLGGTEILEPLQHIYRQPCIPKKPRQLFVFTDGEVSSTKAILDEVKKNADSHRCFSFGIGEGASSALVNGMAREGGGHAEFITGTERMQPKVMQSLRFALQPLVADISVTWDLPNGMSATVLSPPIKTLFQGQRSLIYAQLTGKSSEAAQGCFTMNYTVAGHPCQNQLRFSLQPAEGTRQDTDQKDLPHTRFTVHRLAALTQIRSLEMEEMNTSEQYTRIKTKLVDLSVQSGVGSIFTAFVAVGKSDGKVVQGPLIYREDPNFMPLLRGGLLGLFKESTPNVFRRAYSSLRKRTRTHGSTIKKKLTSAFSGTAFSFRNDQSASPQSSGENGATESPKPPRDPLLQLVSLQEASGCWLLGPALAAALGKTTEEVAKTKPASSKTKVWATILALIWLHGFKMDAKQEWELLAMKATSWLCDKRAVWITECVEAGNELLGCNVQKDELGL